MIKLTLPLTPLLNRYYRSFRGRMVMSADGRAYKSEVVAICASQFLSPFEGEVRVLAHVYRKRKAGDTDGYIKGLLDSLQGWCYLNDSQIVDLHITRHDDKHNPRVEVEISEF